MSATRRINEIVRRKLLGRVLYEQGQSVVTLRDVTFGITSFERPIHLRALLESIRRYYPEANILVADCSHAAPPVPYDAELIRLPFDIGLSEMRNALIRRLRTKYFLLLEEDFVFTAETRIEPLIDVLESDATVGSVGGSMRLVGRDGIQDYAVNHDIFGRVVSGVTASGKVLFGKAGTPYRTCHKHLNFGLWRRDMLLEHSWAGLPKLGEHTPYFLRVGAAGRWRVAHTRSSIVLHDKSRTQHYLSFRQRASKMMATWTRANGSIEYWQEPGLVLPRRINDRPCLILMGIGHSGTTIAARMLFEMGWQRGDADEEFGESASVRSLNAEVRGANASINVDWRLDRHKARGVLQSLPRPWAIKDPRWIYALPEWLPELSDYEPMLVWLRRDANSVAQSYLSRGELSLQRAHEVIADGAARAQHIFEAWPWAKVAIDFEQLGSMAALFDRSKIKSGCDVPATVPDWQI